MFFTHKNIIILLGLLISAFAEFNPSILYTTNEIDEYVPSPQWRSIDDEEITPETWRSIHLEIRKTDGSMAKIDLLRPLWWLEETKAEVGGTLNLSILEMGIEGDAKIIKIGPCSTDSRNRDPKYQVVTGKYTYENAIILDLTFNNDAENNLGVTPNHRFWSTSRNAWVEAEQLKIGESVKTKDGIAQLTTRSQRPGRHTVYNLEVHKSHTFYVANQCILTHNQSSAGVVPGAINAGLASKSAKGITGIDFENYLQKKLSGRGSFKMDGRQFDGAYNNRWYEAKSGKYWENHAQIGKGFDKFRSDIGERASIARKHGALFEVHSNTPIPSHVKDWLTKKGIPFFEHE